jgi:hypothetical protein
VRLSSSQMRQVLTGASFTFRWVADVIVNGQRVMQDLPCTAPDFTDDDSQQVQSTGSLTFVYQGDFADSIAPTGIPDVLSPFGTQVWVYVLVQDGPAFSERVLMGQYLVTSTPKVNTSRMLFMGKPIVVGDQITVDLSDLLYGVQVNKFDVPGSPPSLASTWGEVQRLTGLPLTRTVPDGPISSTVAYQEDRLQAVYDLANYSLDAVPYVTPDGTISMRPNVWPDPVDVLASGDDGNLIDVSRSLTDESVFNAVVVRSYDTTNGAAILASGEITTGPLRTREPDGSLSPFRRRPTFYSSQFLTTKAQAQDYVRRWLPRVSQLTGVEVVLTETFNPLRELGDVLTVHEVGNDFTGRIVSIRRTDSGQQTTTVAVNQ